MRGKIGWMRNLRRNKTNRMSQKSNKAATMIQLVVKLGSRLAKIARLTRRVADPVEPIIQAEQPGRLIRLLPMILLIRAARIMIKVAIRLHQIQQQQPSQRLMTSRPQAQTQMPPLPVAALLPQDRRRQQAIRISLTARPQPLQTSQKKSPTLTHASGGKKSKSRNPRLSMSPNLCLMLSQPPKKRSISYSWSSITTCLISRCPRR